MSPRRLFTALSPGADRSLADVLREERFGGLLLLAATVVALTWANVWPAAYRAVTGQVVGPASLHLDLPLATWASDGLLAVFFFVVGLELKRELVAGELRDPRTAVVPVVAAVGGMLVPASVYVVVNAHAAGGDLAGWAVPTATDIAFAVTVLAVVGRRLPNSLRAFVLTLAVVDDLLAIVVIGVFYADDVRVWPLLGALAAVAAFAALLRRAVTSAWVLGPLAVLAWGLLHASGVHSTITGVLLGMSVPATATATQRSLRLPDLPAESLAQRWEHRWRPWSAGLAVPLFALLVAGVPLSLTALGDALHDPVAQGVALGLVVGKPLGIVAATMLVAGLTRATLAPGLGWGDVFAVGLLGGIGFTVSLLVGELAFGAGSAHDEHVVVAVLVASLVAALLGGVALLLRDRHHAAVRDLGGGTR